MVSNVQLSLLGKMNFQKEISEQWQHFKLYFNYLQAVGKKMLNSQQIVFLKRLSGTIATKCEQASLEEEPYCILAAGGGML